MKRNAIFWMTVAVICVSCSKVMVQDEKSQPDESGKDVYQGAVAVTFTAVSDDTKTTIGELVEGKRSISWEKDDEIAIFFSDKTTTSKAVSAGLSTEFTANVDEADAYYAVYPASAGSLNGNEVTVSIPSTQDVSSGFRAAHYAAALAVDDNFAFKNICGWIKFTVEDPEIKRIIVRGNGEQAITGNVTVTFDESGNIASTTVSGGNSRLIIDIDGAGEYYAAVLPGMNLENGVGFRFYTDHSTDSGKAVSPGVFNPNALAVERGAIANLGGIDSRIISDWYIAPSASGTGDGTSAENAAEGVSFLRRKLAQDQTSTATKNGLAKGYGCIGITIHAAAGEYDFAGEEIQVSWPGHTSLIGTGIVGEEGTVFTNTGESRFFNIGKNVNLKLNGIKVRNGKVSDTGTGGAIYVGDATALLELDACTFEYNSADTGGALYVLGGLTANSTDFISNSATTAAGAAGLAGTGVISFTDCNFRDNQAARHAGAIQNFGSSGMKLNITGGEISGNSTTDTSAGGGGALSFRGSGTETTIDGVTVSGNTSAYQGGAMRIYADNTILVKDADILSNTAVTGGGLYVNAGTVDFGGLLKGNVATDKGAAVFVSGASTLRIDGAVITQNQSKTYAAGICVYPSADISANVWLNNCSIFGNSNTTTSTSTSWGPAILVAPAASSTKVCLNNTTIADHSTAVTSGSDTNVDLQGGSLVFANSTMIATSAAGLLRIHSSAKDGCFLNSIVINKNGKSINFNSSGGTLTSAYVISGTPQNKYSATADIDLASVTYADLGSPAFDETDYVYKWNGTLAGCPAAPGYSVVSEKIQAANADFYAWLESLGALSVDALGNPRSINRQGAYCGN